VRRLLKNAGTNREVDFTGDYPGWEPAKADCSGYNDLEILEQCKKALLQVKNGSAAFERDGVVFDNMQYNWPLLVGLQKAALERAGNLSILDFGGSLGSSFYQNRAFLSGLQSLSWSIVEQKHFVECGRQNFENENLAFYDTIEECLNNRRPDVLLLSGVIQYLEFPYQWLGKFNLLKTPYIIFDRTSFVHHSNEILTKQRVPESFYSASYPAWFFNEGKISEALSNYELVLSFPSYCEPAEYLLNGVYKACWKGMIYRLKY
jgi:putative methyltransferase (TIGR04325 family)